MKSTIISLVFLLLASFSHAQARTVKTSDGKVFKITKQKDKDVAYLESDPTEKIPFDEELNQCEDFRKLKNPSVRIENITFEKYGQSIEMEVSFENSCFKGNYTVRFFYYPAEEAGRKWKYDNSEEQSRSFLK